MVDSLDRFFQSILSIISIICQDLEKGRENSRLQLT